MDSFHPATVLASQPFTQRTAINQRTQTPETRQKSLPRPGPSAGGFLLPADLTAGTDPRRRLAINHSTDGRVTHMISDWFLWRNVEQRVFNVALFQITFPFATVSKRWICIAVDGAEHKISWIYWGWKRWGRRGPRGRKLPTGTRSIDTFFSPT